MAVVSSRASDELAKAIRSLVDKALEAQTREQIAARGRELAQVIATSAGTTAERASEIAEEAWRGSEPQRREAARSARRMSADALKWGRATWRRRVGPALRDAWDGRAAALGAAGIAVPTSRELTRQVQRRLGTRREERRWRTFFLGVVIGAIAGAVVALLTAPRPGKEMRDELTQRARVAAGSAGDWVPLFQRSEVTEAAESTPSEVPADEAIPPVEAPTERSRRSKGNGAEPRASGGSEEAGEAL